MSTFHDFKQWATVRFEPGQPIRVQLCGSLEYHTDGRAATASIEPASVPPELQAVLAQLLADNAPALERAVTLSAADTLSAEAKQGLLK